MADALGWQTGRLRALFKRADYHAPYTDRDRALHIVQTYIPEQLPAVLKALNLDAAFLRPPDNVGGQQLALMPPAPQTTPNVPVISAVTTGLVDRLARMIPGDAAFTVKRQQVRSMLKKHGADGRMKDQARAMQWLKKAFPGAVEEQDAATVIRVPDDVETLPVEQLRPLIKSLRADLSERDRQLKLIQARFGEVNYFLNATKGKMVGDSGLFDVSEEQALFFLALAAARKPL